MVTAEEIIQLLGLKPHPREGGFFAETYRSRENIPGNVLPTRYGEARAFGTSIYYLLKAGTFSAMHRLQSDEIFHFYLGDPVEMLQLPPDGTGRIMKLGPDLVTGERPQIVVSQNVWQGSRLAPGGKFALLGCTVAPGFDYADYAHGRREELVRDYPEFREWIEALTLA